MFLPAEMIVHYSIETFQTDATRFLVIVIANFLSAPNTENFEMVPQFRWSSIHNNLLVKTKLRLLNVTRQRYIEVATA